MAESCATGRYATPESRWAGIGPYYAMFPPAFADEVIQQYSAPGDLVLDPFAGRGTSLFSASTAGRAALGVEISPVGYVYAAAKLHPAPKYEVLRSLDYVQERTHAFWRRAERMPEFYHYCYSPPVRRFLLAARSLLDWRNSRADRTLMALILVSLHGKRAYSLSNQMRQSTSMWPSYCVKWWKEKTVSPRDLDPVEFLRRRIAWRYAKGTPNARSGRVILGDSRTELTRLHSRIALGKERRPRLLFTSPPYCNVTNYYTDQWLRIWILGGPDLPSASAGHRYGNKLANRAAYRRLLEVVFGRARSVLKQDATVYVRSDFRPGTYHPTVDVLERMFPDKVLTELEQPLSPDRQTKPYSRGGAPRRATCEVDLVLVPA